MVYRANWGIEIRMNMSTFVTTKNSERFLITFFYMWIKSQKSISTFFHKRNLVSSRQNRLFIARQHKLFKAYFVRISSDVRHLSFVKANERKAWSTKKFHRNDCNEHLFIGDFYKMVIYHNCYVPFNYKLHLVKAHYQM